METTGILTDLTVDYKTKQPKIVLQLNAEACDIEKFKDMKLSVEIKKFRNKRSLDANKYAWKLITEMANVLRTDKDELYFELLKRYGQRTYVSVLSFVNAESYFKYFSVAGESEIKGRKFRHYFIYKGSSEFDSREMSIFIDGIIYEAKAMGIATETPDEIARMKSLWKDNGFSE